MKTKLTIGLTGMIAVVVLFMGIAAGEKVQPATVDEQIGQTKEFVTFECDPCDYNLDYGQEDDAGKEDTLREGLVKVECDPCDYNTDFGKTDAAEK
ncbi:MAG: hypothetical protein AMK71_03125 [Nitrospira bacterium SG8_35_4]|nr:MAG: hypothetical protein AMK71_03125 [Nitrospira bacterium SG8_35_4]